jgi:VanZ family protein
MIRIYRLVFLVLVLLISYAALTPQGDISIPYIDKIFHFSGFLILSLFLDLSIKKNLSSSKTALIFLLFYALSIEFVQYFLPYRSAELFDFISDLLGILVYLYFAPKLNITHSQ